MNFEKFEKHISESLCSLHLNEQIDEHVTFPKTYFVCKLNCLILSARVARGYQSRRHVKTQEVTCRKF